LKKTQSPAGYWSDKWHASPYYTTAHAIIECSGYSSEGVEAAVNWITSSQNPDGSWGYYMPTAEETAYSLQALAIWNMRAGPVPREILDRGRVWLEDHAEMPYPKLWIGKSLYCPELVVHSSILSALMLTL
jgi:halimadienyl-diphosphate synthase